MLKKILIPISLRSSQCHDVFELKLGICQGEDIADEREDVFCYPHEKKAPKLSQAIEL